MNSLETILAIENDNLGVVSKQKSKKAKKQKSKKAKKQNKSMRGIISMIYSNSQNGTTIIMDAMDRTKPALYSK